MHLIGCDFHTRFQQMAMVDSATGKILNRRLDHGTGEAQQFYAALPSPARIGMEATGRTNWFERMLTKQPSVFHGFLPIPSFRCYYTVLGRLLSLATPTPSPLDGLHLLPQLAPHSSFNPLRLGWNSELDKPVLKCCIEPADRSVFTESHFPVQPWSCS